MGSISWTSKAISACEKCGMWSIGLIALSTCTACSTLADVISLTATWHRHTFVSNGCWTSVKGGSERVSNKACISAYEKSRHWRMGIGETAAKLQIWSCATCPPFWLCFRNSACSWFSATDCQRLAKLFSPTTSLSCWTGLLLTMRSSSLQPNIISTTAF